MLLWALCGVFAGTTVILTARLALLHQDLNALNRDFAARLEADTNVGLDSGSQDRHIRAIASQLDRQLHRLRQEQLKYRQGDLEVKEAVTNISHDLRTPLTAICGYLELLEQEEVPDNVRRYLSLIGNRVEAMRQLTAELFRYSLTVSGEEPLQWESVDIGAAVEECAASFYAAFTEREIIPHIQLPRTRVVRQLDKAALHRVLGNILNNALKYSGGDLEVILETDGTLTFSNMAPGLSQVQVGRLFDRFFTVAAARNSTGLGLSISKLLIERMGGTIQARYDKDRLWIIIYFPDITR